MKSILFTNTSPDGYIIEKEQIKNNGTVTGIFASNVFLTKGSEKKLVAVEKSPVGEFKFIGWIER